MEGFSVVGSCCNVVIDFYLSGDELVVYDLCFPSLEHSAVSEESRKRQ